MKVEWKVFFLLKLTFYNSSSKAGKDLDDSEHASIPWESYWKEEFFCNETWDISEKGHDLNLGVLWQSKFGMWCTPLNTLYLGNWWKDASLPKAEKLYARKALPVKQLSWSIWRIFWKQKTHQGRYRNACVRFEVDIGKPKVSGSVFANHTLVRKSLLNSGQIWTDFQLVATLN